MISGNLVHLIECHGDQIIARVVEHVRRDPETASTRPLIEAELREWGPDLLKNLGRWLSPAGREELGRRYERLGRQLSDEGIPADEALRAWFLIREKALDYLEEQISAKTHVALYEEEELDRRMARFFDSLAIHLIRGYVREVRKMAAA
jgi:hypothetical protein